MVISKSGLEDEPGETLPERIEARVARLIGSGALPPGARLPSERELARTLGVSRLAAREAVRRLEARGLVGVRRGAGSFVASAAPAAEAPPPVAAMEELADVRLLLEPAAADWAARRADRTAVALLLRIVEQFEEAAAREEPGFDRLAVADLRLHHEIALAAENALLAQLVEQVHTVYRSQLAWSLRRPGRLAASAREHRRIVDAIAAGDPAAARAAMSEHLSAAAASFRAIAAGGTAVD